MKKILQVTAGLVALMAAAEITGAGAALARGGGANIMDSPGYQRRLQESRGYVTNRSGSIFAEPAPAPVFHPRKWRRRR